LIDRLPKGCGLRAGLEGLAGRMRPAGRQLDNAALGYCMALLPWFYV